jgi:hypothetical protein
MKTIREIQFRRRDYKEMGKKHGNTEKSKTYYFNFAFYNFELN